MESERLISFRIPDGLDPLDLLEQGFAIDGKQAVASVFWDHLQEELPHVGPFVNGRSLTSTLQANQLALVEYLRERGFEPKFV